MKIKSIKSVKPQTVYAIQTSTSTFIADGLAHHNCAGCNKWGNGEPQMYEDEIRLMYGDEEVDRIRGWVHKTRKWTPMELEEKFNYYKEKLKEYKP